MSLAEHARDVEADELLTRELRDALGRRTARGWLVTHMLVLPESIVREGDSDSDVASDASDASELEFDVLNALAELA